MKESVSDSPSIGGGYGITETVREKNSLVTTRQFLRFAPVSVQLQVKIPLTWTIIHV